MVIECVAAEWEKLALALHIPASVIRIVEKDNRRTEAACRDMLQRWLDGRGESHQPVNWATLIKSLREAGFDVVAEDLQEVMEYSPLLQERTVLGMREAGLDDVAEDLQKVVEDTLLPQNRHFYLVFSLNSLSFVFKLSVVMILLALILTSQER